MRKVAVALLVALSALAGVRVAAPMTHPPVVIIFMENKSYAAVLAHAAVVPYEMSFITQGLRFTNYGSAVHPSLPNYLQVASGSTCGKDGTDSTAAGQLTAALGCGTTVWDQLQGAGFTWGAFMDDMGVPCPVKRGNTVLTADGGQGDQYALKHNPALPFASVYGGGSASCKANVVPFTSFDPTTLRDVSFISPGICDDQHGSKAVKADGTPLFQNCVIGSDANYARGDNWLAANVPPMLAAGAIVFITYDGPARPMYAVEVGPGIAPGTVETGTSYNHCSTLAGLELRYGLPLLGCAQTAIPLPIG